MTQQTLPTATAPADGGWPPHPPVPPRNRHLLLFLAAMAAGLVLMLVIATGAFLAGRATQPAQLGRAGSGTGDPIADVAAKVDPGVVDINTVLGYANGAVGTTAARTWRSSSCPVPPG